MRLKGPDLYNCDDSILGKEGLKALLIDNFSRVPFSCGIRRENFVFANRTNHHSMCTTLQVFPCHIRTTQCSLGTIHCCIPLFIFIQFLFWCLGHTGTFYHKVEKKLRRQPGLDPITFSENSNYWRESLLEERRQNIAG